MNESDLYFVLTVEIPIFMFFATGTLLPVIIQSFQLAKVDQTAVGKNAMIGGLSFAVSIAITVVVAFFGGIIVCCWSCGF